MSIAIGTPPDDPYGFEQQFAADLRKKPLLFAVGIHLLIALFILFPLDFFSSNRNIEEIYTIDLFDTADLGSVKKIAAPPPPPKVITPPKSKSVITQQTKPVTSLASVETTPGKVISLKPRLQKKDLRQNKLSKAEQLKVNAALDRLKADLDRKQAEQKVRETEKKADDAVDDAVSKLRDLLHASAPFASTTQPSSPTATTGGSGSSSVINAAEKRYYVTISQQIHEHWILPELQEWTPNLKSVVVVHVRRDGIVTKQHFEQKSDNRFFNQFVEKTLKESLPFPPFPSDLKEHSLEIGLVFHPGGLM